MLNFFGTNHNYEKFGPGKNLETSYYDHIVL